MYTVFTQTQNHGPDFMYRPKCHSLNGGNTLDWETLDWGKQCVILYGAMARITRNEHKMQENPRLVNLKSGFHCMRKHIKLFDMSSLGYPAFPQQQSNSSHICHSMCWSTLFTTSVMHCCNSGRVLSIGGMYTSPLTNPQRVKSKVVRCRKHEGHGTDPAHPIIYQETLQHGHLYGCVVVCHLDEKSCYSPPVLVAMGNSPACLGTPLKTQLITWRRNVHTLPGSTWQKRQ
jgi:hypothetical protein